MSSQLLRKDLRSFLWSRDESLAVKENLTLHVLPSAEEGPRGAGPDRFTSYP